MITIKMRNIFALTSLFIFTTVYFYNTKNPDIMPIKNEQTEQTSSTFTDNNKLMTNTLNEVSAPNKPRSLITEVTYDNYYSSLGPLPKSLRGTRIPAAFSLDSEGHLVITSSIKSVIEYFLSATGEESLETIIARIEEFMTQQLEEPARSEALDLVAQYITYKEALIGLESDLADNTKLSGQSSDYLTMFQYRREARMNNLSPEVYDAFFADEDKADSYTASLLEIKRNQNLSLEEKSVQYLAAEQLLPEREQVAKKSERTRETLQLNIQAARDKGASNDDIFQMRADVYGYEAAERFAAADIKKEKWNNRFEQYRQSRQSILENEGLSNTDKMDEISTLQQSSFSQTEQKRLATLEQIADKKLQL